VSGGAARHDVLKTRLVNGETIGMTRSRALIGFIGAALVIAASTSAKSDPRAVIELFTSQGCSSCPPADKLIADLRNDPTLLVLSLPIDYWDYLGWKDTLALPGHAARQKAYSQMRGDREIYTPQVVVNGMVQALGSDRGEIEKAVTQSRHNVDALKIPIRVAIADERVTVTLPNGSSDDAAGELWLCPLSRSVAVGIGRGENRGRTITYTNVVRRWVKLGTWSGKSETLSVPLDTIKAAGIDGFAIMLQAGNSEHPGAMLGATLGALH
jgi:hypothetical protein